MTDHEMVLLRAAVEEAQSRGMIVSFSTDEGATIYDPEDAAALLRDLGADVPEWPSEERVAELREDVADTWMPRALICALTLPECLALRGSS